MVPFCGTIKHVRSQHRKTLDRIFARPDRKDVRWEEFISLLVALGADLDERGGSMVGVRLRERYAVFHRPHPGNEIYPTDLKRIRRFLFESGVLEEG
jgi:hypothetical protein